MIQLQQELTLLLKTWQQQGLITALDRHFALEMRALHQDADDFLTLFCALVSRQLSQQHTCLPLDQIDINNPLREQTPQCCITIDTPQMIQRLSQYQAVATAPNHLQSPLILDGNRLYLQRYYHFETQVAERLNGLNQPLTLADMDESVEILNCLFPNTTQDYDWQKIATATALSQKLAVITGGPGTGKTTTVTKLLLLLCLQQSLTIRLVAPTGKAAARLSESIKASKMRLRDELANFGDTLDITRLAQVPEEASTLHRLLGVIPDAAHFRHNKDNPLRLDLLIVDEASMVDLPMMYKLLDALPSHARLILLGDQDQLASVEAGAVLADICAGLKHSSTDADSSWSMRYSVTKADILTRLTGYDLSPFVSHHPALGDSLAMLMHSHRFQGDAGIGQLASAVNLSDLDRILTVWQRGYEELNWLEHQPTTQGNQGLDALLTLSVEAYRPYLDKVKHLSQTAEQDSDCQATQLINAFNDYRLLCAMRAGEYGVEGINASVTQALANAGLIQPATEFYAGRPVIIQSNDYNLGLFNGDIGVILPDMRQPNRLMAYFIQADGTLLKVLPARLPRHETCYAMTVHKSQGSEFKQVALVLPPRPSVSQRQLLTKELVYTAITRAKSHFTCLGSQIVFEQACRQATLRASGLAERLWQA